MANLNFQQPPRSIASGSLSNRNSGFGGGGGGGGGGVGGGTSISGHVTPTSGMFQANPGNYGTSQAQLSPNRSIPMPAAVSSVGAPLISNNNRTNIFGQRATFSDRRAIQGLGPMSSMGSFMQSRGYGQSGNFHSVFGNSANDASGTPPLLDLSEFPSLTNARGSDSLPQTNALQPPGSKPYVGMVKQPTAEQSEFQMSNEDFPALPGTQIGGDGSMVGNNMIGHGGSGGGGGIGGSGSVGNSGAIGSGGGGIGGSGGVIGGVGIGGGIGSIGGGVGSGGIGNDKISGSGSSGVIGMDLQSGDTISVNEKAFKRGVQTLPDGKVTNIPSSMVNNQFGMVGLLTFIRAAETDPNLVTLAMGQDLTGLGLNLNSQENLYPTFGGPFSDQPCRPQDIDFHVPPEYLVNMSIRDKLANLQLKKYKDDLLFFLFYANVGEFMQLAAAAELHSRDWRYHVEEKVWITRVPGITHYEKLGNTERGTFYYFDAQNWRRVPKDFQIDAGKLDKCPNLTSIISVSGQPV